MSFAENGKCTFEMVIFRLYESILYYVSIKKFKLGMPHHQNREKNDFLGETRFPKWEKNMVFRTRN